MNAKYDKFTVEYRRDRKERFSRPVKQYAEREGVTEQLKAENQMKWVGLMNNIRSRAEEAILNDIIYN